MALCPTQIAEDKSAALFTENFDGRVSELITNGLQVIGQVISPVRVEPRQDCLYGYPGSRETESSWTAAAYWDGSVSAVFTMPGTELYPSDLIPRVKQAWRAIVQIALAAGVGATRTWWSTCAASIRRSPVSDEAIPPTPSGGGRFYGSRPTTSSNRYSASFSAVSGRGFGSLGDRWRLSQIELPLTFGSGAAGQTMLPRAA